MPTSLTATLSYIEQQVSIYFGIPLLIGGVFGGFLAITVFLSLQTFRQNSCGFYLIIMQFFNLGQLFSGLLSRIMMTGFNIDLTITSNIFCKLRLFVITTCPLMSLTCLCLATIDQYFASCSRRSWQKWSNLKLAHRLVIIFALIWLLHEIPYLVLVDIVKIPFTGMAYCSTKNYIFLEYHNYFTFLILIGFLPISILSFFGCLAYYNVRQMNYRTVPLARQESDKQLTVMILLQILLNLFSLLPLAIAYVLLLSPQIMSDPITASYIEFFSILTNVSFYVYFAGPFYVYICASERFRRQLIYVLFKIHLNRWQRRKLIANQVAPEVCTI